jgi:site-specific recombinase XerD
MNYPEFFQDASNFTGFYAQQYRLFVLKRISLKNVTMKSVAWYQQSFAAYRPALEAASDEKQLRLVLEDQIEIIAERKTIAGEKITATTVNTYTRALQAFCGFLAQREVISKPIVLPKLKAAKKLKQPLTDDEIAALFNFKPKTRHDRLIHAAVVLCLDGGLRALEWIHLKVGDIDLNGMTVKVFGKGRKERVIPISFETCRVLRAYLQDRRVDSELAFASDAGTPILHRNALRRIKLLACKAGVRSTIGMHLLRHSFGTRFVSSGGNVALLQQIMGHENITTTQQYLHISINDTKAAHLKYSPISRAAKRNAASKPAA